MKKDIQVNNKPIYKKWWFWVIIVLIIGIISPKDNSDSNNTDDESTIVVQEQVPETKSEESVEVETSTETEPEEKEVLFDVDWDKCIEETKEDIMSQESLDFVDDLFIKVDNDEMKIIITSTVGDSTNGQTALDYADTVVREFNLFANMQDNSIKLGGKDYYGGIYDKYTLMIGISRLSDTDDSDKWLIQDAIVAGAHQSIDLQNE